MTVYPDAIRQMRRAGSLALRPPPLLTVDQHAERTFILPETSQISGRLNLDHTPYLRFPMRCFTDPRVTWIYLCCGTQLGKTTFLFALLNYIVDYAPASTYLLYPSKDICLSMSKDRIQRLFEDCPTLKAHKTPVADDFKLLEYYLDRLTIRFAWNSIISVSGHPAKYVLKDETKDIDSQIDEAVDDRTKSFFGRKIVSASSPLLPDDCIWRPFGFRRDYEAEEMAKADIPEAAAVHLPIRRFYAKGSTTVYKYRVKCPHCQELIELLPDRIRWPRDCAIRELSGAAWYDCQICGDRIEDRHKRKAVQAGRWKTDNEGGRAVGFHLSSLYSLLGESCTFGEIAATYLRAHISKSEKKIQAVTNSFFAFPYEAEEFGTDLIVVSDIADRAADETFRKNELPEGAKIVTAGVDVHKRNIYYSVWAWGEDGVGWLIDWGIYEAEIEVDDRAALAFCQALRSRGYGEKKLQIIAQGTDSGYRPDVVYKWSRENRWIMPVKGERGDVAVPEGMEVYIRKSTKIDKLPDGTSIPGGVVLRSLNTGLLKREIYDSIRAGRYRFPVDVEQNFVDQLNAEKLVTRRRGGRLIQYYTKKRKSDDPDEIATIQNHYLDTVVYARATMEILVGGLSLDKAAAKYYRRSRRKSRKATYD